MSLFNIIVFLYKLSCLTQINCDSKRSLYAGRLPKKPYLTVSIESTQKKENILGVNEYIFQLIGRHTLVSNKRTPIKSMDEQKTTMQFPLEEDSMA